MSKISHQKSYLSKNEKDENDSIIKINSTLDKRSLYKILIKNPYLVNSVDSKKESILSYSIKNHNIQVANLVLTSPILDLNYQDKDGNSYLHLAILYKEEEIVKSLIEKGISVFKQNKEGNTPLHLAYMKNDKRIIHILEGNGIDTSAGTNKNKSVEEININLGKSQKSNNVDIIANNKSISQTKIKYYKNLNYNNDPNAKNKNITSHQTQKKLITSTKPNNITNRGNKLNYPIKLCNTIANLIQSKNKESVNLKYNKQFDINEDIISINEYKIKAHNINDNKKSENEKITKIDFFNCSDSGDTNCKQLTKTFDANATKKITTLNGDTYYKLPDVKSWYFQN
jgi:ankyrin repeat protein